MRGPARISIGKCRRPDIAPPDAFREPVLKALQAQRQFRARSSARPWPPDPRAANRHFLQRAAGFGAEGGDLFRVRAQRRGSGASPSSSSTPFQSPAPRVVCEPFQALRAGRGARTRSRWQRLRISRAAARGLASPRDQQRARRRLLQRLQQRVGGEAVEHVRGREDADLVATRWLVERELLAELPHLLDAQLLRFSSTGRTRMRSGCWWAATRVHPGSAARRSACSCTARARAQPPASPRRRRELRESSVHEAGDPARGRS